MTTSKITGAIEFVSTRGERGGIDDQINDWLAANPNASIVDVQYRVTVYQDGGKNKLAKLALVLYNHGEAAGASAKLAAKSESETEKQPGARTMVMNLRKDLYDELGEAE